MIFMIILKPMSNNIAENIAIIKAKIADVRPQAELIAVSKTHDIAAIREALKAGQRLFGENRVQEAETKFPQLRAEFPDLKLHLIGPLQSNKVKDALEIFDVIQTVDREKLAVALAKESGNRSQVSEFFIQVNIGEEPQKAGIAPHQTAEFFKFCTNDLKLNITGLMCIPPADEPPALFFGLLHNISKTLCSLTPEACKLSLSMGMSGDYEQALKLKADYIRVGSAIFGERPNL